MYSATCYIKGGRVVGISDWICGWLVERAVPRENVHVTPNLVDLDVPLPRDCDFSREHNFYALIAVSYAGNVGHAQGLETILEAAESNHIPGEVRPVLIGDGVLHDRIVARV
jgi:colanic acid biosynthesis glycosyl transferase WcaI